MAQVYAARKGIKKGNMDMTFFVLIIRLQNNVRLKILETKNATKIRKEVSVVAQIIFSLNASYIDSRVIV